MRPSLRRGATIAVLGALALALLLMVIDGLTPSSSGPTSSSYATAPEGLEGYADLLTTSGHTVTRLRLAPARARLDPRETLVLLDPSVLLPADVSALRRFVAAGGDLIAGGQEPGAWLSELMSDPPRWSAAGEILATPLVSVPETAGVSSVQSAGAGSWSNAGATLPAVGEPGRSLLTVATVGAGRIALLADTSPLQNRLLANADNAEFGLALAGPGRPVAFEEAAHGYGEKAGLAALPTRWKWTLVGLILATLVWVAARIRRLGPAQPHAPPTPPARRAHVEALAFALARTGSPGDAAQPVQRHARELVLERARLPADASASAVMLAARELGLDESESEAVGAPALSDDYVLAAGRALSRLSGGSA